MASKVQLELDHSKMTQGFAEGIVMPQCYETAAEHLPKVKAMELRDDDVILCSYPKSGTHWLFRVIDMLQRGLAVFDKRTADSTFLDVQRIERLPELDSPRLFVTHLPWSRLPEQAKDKRTKLVHVYRNPRAVMVSMFFQLKTSDVLKENFADMTLEAMFNNFFSNKMHYGGWFNYQDEVTAYQKQNPQQPVFNISYEEMTKSPLETVKELSRFLEKPASDAFCEEVVAACSFKNQKQIEETQDNSQKTLKFYRKGDVDDWKNHLTVAMNEKFTQVMKDRADHCAFSAKY